MAGKVSARDKIMIEGLRMEKGYGAKKLCSMFPNKHWKLGTMKDLIRKIDETGSSDRKPGSGRPTTVCAQENIDEVDDLVLSQEEPDGKRTRHKSQREISRQLHIPLTSVNRIVKKKLNLHVFKRKKVIKLRPNDKQRRVNCASQFLQRFGPRSLRRIEFSDEKKWYVFPPLSTQNDRVYARETKKHDVAPERIEREQTKCDGVWVSFKKRKVSPRLR